MIEKFVVVLENQTYKSGIGYTGRVLRELGFPPAPWIKKTAEIFIRQAKTVDPKLKFKIVDYKP